MTRADGSPRRRPSAWFYLLVVLLPIGGCALTVSQMAEEASTINQRIAALPRAAATGESRIGLAKGESAVFFVSPTTSDGSSVTKRASTDAKEPAPVDCTLVSPQGVKVPLETTDDETRFTMNHLEGRLLFAVKHDRAGFYQLSCAYSATGAAKARPGDALVFVGADFFKDLATPLLPGIVGALAGIGVWVVVFFSRRRAS
jgi:hypothetical protein